MGSDTILECNKCGHKVSIRTGIGMRFSRLGNVIDSIDENQRKQIQEIIEKYKIDDSYGNPDLVYERRAYKCEKCGRFDNCLYVKIRYDGDKIYETTFKCIKCKIKLLDISMEDMSNTKCPKCGIGELEPTAFINWD